MNIFLSWSGNTSRICANIVKDMLEDCFGESVNAFMSSEDITLGTYGITTIFSALANSEVCIAFITPMNVNAPWISFESGVIAAKSELCTPNGKSIIIPVFLCEIDSKYFSKHPLNNFQYCNFSRQTLERICEIILKRIESRDILKFMRRISTKLDIYYEKIVNQITQIPGDGKLEAQGLIELLSDKVESFYAQGKVTYFSNGFETPILYETILKYVDKRLYVYGRKNTKLFTNTNRPFFDDLTHKIENGFDFKCLFLSPSSQFTDKAQDDKFFLSHLKDRILSAKTFIDDKLFDTLCRSYDARRDTAIIIADNAVIYSPIRYLPNGTPTPLTHSDFYITSTSEEIGSHYLEKFKNAWEISRQIELPSAIFS